MTSSTLNKSLPLWVFVLLWSAWMPAQAQRSGEVQRDHVVVELVSEVEAVTPGQPFRVGLSLRHAPDWHTYWRNPGDSGLETRIDWTLPDGFAAGEIQWPYPERHVIEHLVNFGYSGEILLPVQIAPPDTLANYQTVTIGLKADWLVCKIECIPGTAELALELPVLDRDTGAQQPIPRSDLAPRFARADARRPEPVDWQARFATDGGRLSIQVQGADRLEIDSLLFFPAHPTLVEHAATPFFALDGHTLQISQPLSPYFSQPPESLQFLLVDPDAARAWALTAQPGTLQSVGPVPGAAGADQPLYLLIAMALAGGILLNLMPCVFPVLSLKAMSLVSSGLERPLSHALAYTAGILVAFAVLAGTLLALRAGGEAIGWGFQLQSPWFVGVLIYLLFAMGLSLSGLVEFGTRWMGLGQNFADSEGPRGSFFTGVLATLVASPCTAPFMGTALGVAVMLPSAQAMTVFLALGLGLALPLAAIGLWPPLARILPRPGPWMETFKQFMAFPLYLTVVWLIWVLARQTGPDGVGALLAGLVALAFALWMVGRSATHRPTAAPAHAATALALIVALAALVAATRQQGETRPTAESPWERFSDARLAEINANPEIGAFVNMTADWCVTCLVNERVSLNTETVRRAMRESGTIYLKGDWTRRDPAITRYLERFGRNGVPLYVFYPAGNAENPVVLPQILTPATVAAALNRN